MIAFLFRNFKSENVFYFFSSQNSKFANMIITRSFNSGLYALAINGTIRHQLNIGISGYTPLGIIQVGVTYYSLCSIGEMQISGNTAYISVRNESQTDIYNQNTNFVVLYIKS